MPAEGGNGNDIATGAAAKVLSTQAVRDTAASKDNGKGEGKISIGSGGGSGRGDHGVHKDDTRSARSEDASSALALTAGQPRGDRGGETTESSTRCAYDDCSWDSCLCTVV